MSEGQKRSTCPGWHTITMNALALICEQLLLTDEGGAGREQAYKWFTSNFEPGQTIEIAYEIDKLLMK